MQAATRSSWKILPLPAQQDQIELAVLHLDPDGVRIRLGHVPQDIDDKWFIFLRMAGSMFISRGQEPAFMASISTVRSMVFRC